MPNTEIHNLIKRIKSIYSQIKPDIPLDIKTHDALIPRLQESHNGKHAVQQASLLGHMSSNNLLRTDRTLAEFGSGSGEIYKSSK